MSAVLAHKPTPETFANELARLYQFHRMYPAGNPNVAAATSRAASLIAAIAAPVRFSRIGDTFYLEDAALENPSKHIEKLFEGFYENRWESVRFSPEIGEEGLYRVLKRMTGPDKGNFASTGFAGGNFNIGEKEVTASAMPSIAAGYLGLMPLAEEMLSLVASGKRGAWLRAQETIKTLSDYTMSGANLFGVVENLKDYDEYTFTHALNVSMIATSMARHLHVSDRVIDAITLGGLCHDVGKQAIPYEVLRKPGQLDAREREVMDRHPVEGAAMILANPDDVPALVPVIAFQHHMHPNGGGYPSFPYGSNPHPASLLVAVADTYDALRTLRPYQPVPKTPEHCLTIMLELADNGVHHRLFVSVLARLIGTVSAGKKVRLSDGRGAVILSAGEFDVLTPLVETEDMEILDLSVPKAPQLKEIFPDGEVSV